MDARNEILDAIQILIGRALESTTKIYNATCKGLVSGNVALMRVNGVDTRVVFYGDAPDVNKQYRVFVPEGNMSNAFMITGGGTGSSKPTVVDYNALVGKPSINGTTVQGNQTSKDLKLYGDGNQPPYPVTSVNGQTGDVTIAAGGVTSVNGKSGDVTLTASDVGAVSIADVTQTLGSSTTKVPSEKAVADALSGAGAGDMLKATYDPTGSVAQAGGIPDYVAGQLPMVNDATLTIQKNGAAVGTFTANASANKSINITMAKGDVGLSNVDNVKQYSADNPPPYPVTSVNGKTGAVNLDIPTIPENLVKYNAISPVEATTPVNADTLQGHAASYFATASDLSAVEQSIDGKLDKAGGTMTGKLIAQSNADYTVRQVRNIILSATEPTADMGEDGDICIVYKIGR